MIILSANDILFAGSFFRWIERLGFRLQDFAGGRRFINPSQCLLYLTSTVALHGKREARDDRRRGLEREVISWLR